MLKPYTSKSLCTENHAYVAVIDNNANNIIVGDDLIVSHKADMIINIASNAYEKGKEMDNTIDIPIPYIYVNAVGMQHTTKNVCVYDGNSSIYNEGKLITNCNDSFKEECKIADLNDELADANDKVANLTDALGDAELVSVLSKEVLHKASEEKKSSRLRAIGKVLLELLVLLAGVLIEHFGSVVELVKGVFR